MNARRKALQSYECKSGLEWLTEGEARWVAKIIKRMLAYSSTTKFALRKEVAAQGNSLRGMLDFNTPGKTYSTDPDCLFYVPMPDVTANDPRAIRAFERFEGKYKEAQDLIEAVVIEVKL